MFAKSFYFDRMFLQIKAFGLGVKISFLLKKYTAIVTILLGKVGRIAFKGINMQYRDLSSIGTTQSSMVDFYADIVAANIISTPNPVIIDVGANIGQFCNAAKIYFPQASVYSFEPDPDIFKELAANTQTLKKVKTFNLGLGEKKEKLPFYKHDLSLMSSFKKYTDFSYDESQTLHLDIDRLDAIIPTKNTIDLLKIDVEGFELNVLKGAQKVLQKSSYLLLELSLERDQSKDTNLGLLHYIFDACPGAKIVKFGRPLGDIHKPTCQDVLIKLKS